MDWFDFILIGLSVIYVYVNKVDVILNNKIDIVDKVVNVRVNELISGIE